MDDQDEGGFKLLDRPGREITLNAHRWILAVLEGRNVVLGPETDPMAVRQLCGGLATVAAARMVAYARLERRLGDAEAHSESAAELRHAIAGLELLALGDAPPQAGQPMPESPGPDVPSMSPDEARIAARVWGYVAEVAVEGRRTGGSVPAEIAENLAAILLGYITGTRVTAGMTQEDAAEAAARTVTSYRDLYGSLGAGD